MMIHMHAEMIAPTVERERTPATRAASTDRGDPTLPQRIASVAGAVAVALLAPVVILLIGLPVVFVVRLLVEAVTWIFTALL
jgi:hypothetical protein